MRTDWLIVLTATLRSVTFGLKVIPGYVLSMVAGPEGTRIIQMLTDGGLLLKNMVAVF